MARISSSIRIRGQVANKSFFLRGKEVDLTDDTRQALVAHAQESGDLRHGTEADRAEFTRRAGEMFQMIASTSEFQFG